MLNFLQKIGTSRIRVTFEFIQKAAFCDYVPRAVVKRKSKIKGVDSSAIVDLTKITAIGGKGGDGLVSFLQMWANDRAGPDGGDGGNGGHVVFEASRHYNQLMHLKKTERAEDGIDGRSQERHGKNGGNLILKVPLGTVIRNDNGKIVGDLKTEGDCFIAARGGAGGKGNPFFKSATEQMPKVCEYGANGENISYTIELKSMAHLGFIGLPNAGKSTLLTAITRACPKVANYAFTTLQPHLGIIHYEDYEQITIADLPGLIQGSHQNKGLGIKFLKHAERCRVLLYVIDLSCEEPWEHYETLRFELQMFSQELLDRPHVIIGNKIDVPEASKNLKSMKELYPDLQIIPISAKMGTNLENLLRNIRILYDKYNRDNEEEEDDE